MSKYDNVSHRVPIEEGNPSIICDDEKCKKCKLCQKTCQNDMSVYGHYDLEKNGDKPICINCGQCVQACPFGAIKEVSAIDKAIAAIVDESKVVVFNTAPAVRIALGDEFGLEPGSFVEKKMVSAIKQLGADYVFDVTFGADLTIMEEASELVDRIKNNGKLPMFTSCCPAWVKFCEIYYPEYIDNLSSAKSPIAMQGTMVKTYFADKMNIDPKNIINITIAPCTAKKAEAKRPELSKSASSADVDIVLTTRELATMLKEKGIDLRTVEDQEFDSIFGKGSGAGLIFGNTGGVMEAALRTAYYLINGKNPSNEDFLKFEAVRGLDGTREATVDLGAKTLKVVALSQTSQARILLDKMKNNEVSYDFIEIMACKGGCANGGGQPKVKRPLLAQTSEARNKSLYADDSANKLRLCHENPEIKTIYKDFLEAPLSHKSHELLHTTFEDKSKLLG